MLSDAAPPTTYADRRQYFVIWSMLDTLYIECLKTLPKIPVTKNKISDDPYITYVLPFVEFYRYQYRYQYNGFVPAYERGQMVKPIFPPKSQVCYIDDTTTDFKSRKKCPQQAMTNGMDPERAYIPLVGRLFIRFSFCIIS